MWHRCSRGFITLSHPTWVSIPIFVKPPFITAPRYFAARPARQPAEDEEVHPVSVPAAQPTKPGLRPRINDDLESLYADQEYYLALKEIACKTALDSPRLFTTTEVGEPLWGTLAPIRKREHVWIPLPDVYDPVLQDRVKNQRPSTKFMVFLYRERDKTLRGLLQFIQEYMLKRRRKMQSYDAERTRILGPELAAAHVFILSGARVKFEGVDRWYGNQDERLVPGRYLESARIEAIDATNSGILYEGLEHLVGCRHLKSLILKNCKDVDDFCLPKLFILANTLEYLDLSGCHKITERGLACLYHLTRLKTLVIDDLPNAENKELTALLLEDEIPWCEIIGVEYNPLALPSPLSERLQVEDKWNRQRVPLYHRIAAPDVVEVGNTMYSETLAREKDVLLKQQKKNLGLKGHGLE